MQCRHTSNYLLIRYTILEKSASLGGTWRHNTYPGCACDVPSHLYSFSFFQNPAWTRAYSRQPEILKYLEDAANKFGILPNVKFGKIVEKSMWEKKRNKWHVETSDGEEFIGDVVVSGLGSLHVAKLPNIPGMEDFAGSSFHTSAWPADYSPKDRDVAVIGTGASAVQTVPGVASGDPSSLTVFQRTPAWSPPRADFTFPEWVKRVFAALPFANTLYRWLLFWRAEWRYRVLFTSSSWLTKKLSKGVHQKVRAYIKAVVKDPELAAKLTPDYEMGCKRITPSDYYLPTFNRDNVHLVTSGIERITSSGIRTVDGEEHKCDTIIFATGFDLDKSVKAVRQRGLIGSLEDDYGDTPSAYLGIAHPNHPNFFSLLGPGTILGHNSVIFMIECEVDYVADALKKMLGLGAKSMAVKEEVFRKYLAYIQENMKGKVFGKSSACGSWYANAQGINWTLWPLDLVTYWWKTRKVNIGDYNLSF